MSTKNPFANAKPRSQWRRPTKKRIRGRVVTDVLVGVDAAGKEDWRLFAFELRSDGLHVRPKGGWKKNEKVWKFDSLANGVGARGGQMKLI